MSGMEQSHRVCILGREFQVRSSASAEQVRNVEELVNGRLAAIQSSGAGGDTVAVACLALLNLAGDYLTLLDEQERLHRHGSERLGRLLRMVDVTSHGQ